LSDFIVEVRHFGIVVKNLKKSLEFYQDILGFEIIKQNNEVGKHLDKMLGLNDVKVKTTKIGIKNGTTLIELLEYSSPNSELIKKKINDLGVSHFALTVKNLDKLIPILKNKGIRINSDTVMSPDRKVKVVFCFDPDETPIELVEEL
jgi:glyoxylase I family protein